MRVLLTSRPALGHVNPMLPLAREAQRAGHEVAFATGAELAPEVARLGFDTWLVAPSRAESDAAFRAAHPDLETLSPQERIPLLISAFAESAATRAAELVPRAQQWRPGIVVHDATELAGPLAAARTGARHVVHGFGLRPAPSLWQGLYGPGFARLCQSWQVPGLAGDFREATYLDICPPSLHGGAETAWRRIQPLRPGAGDPAAGGQLPPPITRLPHSRSIYLTLGTLFHESPGVLETAIAGLRELPLNLIVTSGPGSDPARFGPQPPHVLIEPYIPLALLLPHCHLVVSHGGAGTMLGALAHGLPQLMLPMGADQFMNAQACESAGVALVLRPGELSAEAVIGAAQRLITEPGFGAKASVVRAEIDAMPDAAEVVAMLAA